MASKIISGMQSTSEGLITKSSSLVCYVKNFIKTIYSAADNNAISHKECNDFFALTSRMDYDTFNLLVCPISLAELKETLKACRDSAPSLDGILYSYYKECCDLLLPLPLESWNLAIRTGSLSESHKTLCITFLPKQGKDQL